MEEVERGMHGGHYLRIGEERGRSSLARLTGLCVRFLVGVSVVACQSSWTRARDTSRGNFWLLFAGFDQASTDALGNVKQRRLQETIPWLQETVPPAVLADLSAAQDAFSETPQGQSAGGDRGGSGGEKGGSEVADEYNAFYNDELDSSEADMDDTMSGSDITTPAERTLLPFQREGVEFLLNAYSEGHGALLCDEMGLGKTAQICVFLKQVKGRVLIMGPQGILPHWQRELLAWGYNGTVLLHHGPKRKKPPEGDLILTTYETMEVDRLWTRPWHVVVADEGAIFRTGPITMAYCAARNFETSHFFVLTGTPVQNTPMDLFYLMHLVAPHVLGDEDTYRQHVDLPIRHAVRGFHSEEVAREIGNYVWGLVRPFYLARSNQEKFSNFQEEDVFCPITEQQAEILKTLRDHDHVVPNQMKHHADEMRVLDGVYSEGVPTAKLSALDTLVERFAPHNRMAIYTRLLATVQLLEKRYAKHRPLSITGATSNRDDVIKQFETNPEHQIVICTTQTGGCGLNIPSATRIILYTLDWNPCIDRQASKRSHRLGQNRSVGVYRLISSGTPRTLEEALYDRQVEKLVESRHLARKDDGNVTQYRREPALMAPASSHYFSRSRKETLDTSSLRQLSIDVQEHINAFEAGAVVKGRIEKERTLNLVAQLADLFKANDVLTTDQLLKVLRDVRLPHMRTRWALQQVADFHATNQTWHWNPEKYQIHEKRKLRRNYGPSGTGGQPLENMTSLKAEKQAKRKRGAVTFALDETVCGAATGSAAAVNPFLFKPGARRPKPTGPYKTVLGSTIM